MTRQVTKIVLKTFENAVHTCYTPRNRYVLQEIVEACILFSKRNLDSHNESCIMIATEPTTPLIFHAQPGGTFLFMGCFMYQYPKQILTIAQQVQSYIDAEMVITSRADVEKALKTVGFYRLRGYSFHVYDNATKKYVPGTKFEDILRLYQFDQELSSLIF